MPNNETLETLFKHAIATEKTGRDFYRGLAEKFSHFPEVSDFWREMLKDEIQHAKELKNIRDSLTPEQLLVPVDSSVLWKVEKVLKFSITYTLNSIRSLDDAYELAHELEYSESNMVFELLKNKFVSSDKRKKFVLSEIEDHLTKLMDFSQTFGDAEWRKSIKIESHKPTSNTATLGKESAVAYLPQITTKRRKAIKM